VEGVSRFENVQELLNSIKEFVEEDELLDDEVIARDKTLGTFMQNVTLLTGDEKSAENLDSVKLMTVHAAKGLEFPVVYVVGLEENLFPGAQSLYSLEDLEEERRLFYVAITRAEARLFLTYASTRYKFGTLNYSDPSRFLQEIPENIISYQGDLKRAKAPEAAKNLYAKATTTISKPVATPTPSGEPFIADNASGLQVGMEVAHEKFGEGKVVSIEGRNIEGRDDTRIASIFFSQFGVKKIMLKFARLKILSGGA
jgi:DNA helicase-2/ATP-dependent DNA helicase PcrA